MRDGRVGGLEVGGISLVASVLLPRAFTFSWGMSRKQCPLESCLASDCARASLRLICSTQIRPTTVFVDDAESTIIYRAILVPSASSSWF